MEGQPHLPWFVLFLCIVDTWLTSFLCFSSCVVQESVNCLQWLPVSGWDRGSGYEEQGLGLKGLIFGVMGFAGTRFNVSRFSF